MNDIDFLLFLFMSLAMPAIILGILLTLPLWLLWTGQKLFHREPSNLNWIGILTVGLFSFIITVGIYVYSIINMDYVLTIPSSPIAADKIKYADDAIAEAFQRSIIPPIFQKPCTNKPEFVCELGASYSLKLWDSNFTSDDAPFIGGFVSSFSSMLVVIFGDFVLRKRRTNIDGIDGKIIALREQGNIEGLIKILESKKDWMYRLDAAEALAKMENEKGLKYLVSALESPDADIRDVAKEILAGLKNQHGDSALRSRQLS